MTLSRFTAVVAGVASLYVGVAQAADLPMRSAPPIPPPPIFTWSGAYLGSVAGGIYVDGRADPRCINGTGVSNGPGCPSIPKQSLKQGGFLLGATSGYNLQFGQFVLGIESDIQASNVDKTATVAGPFGIVGGGKTGAGSAAFARQQIDAFGTVRGRLGYAWDRTLFYVTGGVIYANVNMSTNQVIIGAGPQNYIAHSDTRRIGGIAGVGVEYAFTDRWSAKIEGLGFDFGDKTIQSGELNKKTPRIQGDRFKLDGGMVRVGLNYKIW